MATMTAANTVITCVFPLKAMAGMVVINPTGMIQVSSILNAGG
jgi:hypothetical protein